MLLEKVGHFLSEMPGIDSDSVFILGVSGGPDSLALLHVLHRLEVPLIVGHFNHGIRPGAAADAKFVQKFCAEIRAAVEIGHGDTPAFAKANHYSIEEAARVLRYQFLFSLAKTHQAAGVMVGHHADDQVETVLMHFLRGAGVAGLSGMEPRTIHPEWDEKIPLLRPLLGVSRAEIEQYCKSHHLTPLEDPTNTDRALFRNRLRHELIPNLETYNPQFRNVILRMADVFSNENETLLAVEKNCWEQSVRGISSIFVGLDRETFLSAGDGVQRRVLRRAISCLRPGLRDVGLEVVERGRRGAAGPPARVPLVGGMHLFNEYEQFWIAFHEGDLPTDTWPQLGERNTFQVVVPGRVEIENGWFLLTTLEEAPAEGPRDFIEGEENPFQVVVDPLKLDAPLRMRIRQEGDRLTPLGMQGSMKVSGLMKNEKIPRRLRAHWPLLVAGDDIVWVPGLRLSEKYRVTGETETVIRLVMRR